MPAETDQWADYRLMIMRELARLADAHERTKADLDAVTVKQAQGFPTFEHRLTVIEQYKAEMNGHLAHINQDLGVLTQAIATSNKRFDSAQKWLNTILVTIVLSLIGTVYELLRAHPK